MFAADRLDKGQLMLGAMLLGFIVAIGSLAATPRGRADLAAFTDRLAIASGLKRSRLPQAGDHWGGCNDARAVGTAPIYRGEPGYDSDMDGDDDGIACE